MEGNECYHFDRIASTAALGEILPIRVALDIGANLGNMTREICRVFPSTIVHAFEPVPEYFEYCSRRICELGRRVIVYPVAVTAQHLFEDDLGDNPRESRLVVLKATPAFGIGWQGSSQIVPAGQKYNQSTYVESGFADAITTLDSIVQALVDQGHETIDLIKCDCEGAECTFLGCASVATLERCRFIVGEWHDFQRFGPVLRFKLDRTHNTHVAVDPHNPRYGSFFAEL